MDTQFLPQITETINEHWRIIITALAGLVVAVVGIVSQIRSRDPYGIFHLTLNKLPGENSSEPPKTEWLNMGYWKEASNFPQAARALALKLISASAYKSNASVLDVGHGTGDSLLLLLSDPSLPRLSQLTGLTSLPIHHQRSRARVEKYQSQSESTTESDPSIPVPVVNFHCDDAVFHGDRSGHPLDPADPTRFDAILALDCAYHFDTRSLFLEQCFQKLESGGRIALADICFSSSQIQNSSILKRLLSRCIRLMPQHNESTVEEYVRQMESIGYEEVVADDITQDVFPGFVAFLKSRKGGWWIFGQVIQWFAGLGAKFVIVSATKP